MIQKLLVMVALMVLVEQVVAQGGGGDGGELVDALGAIFDGICAVLKVIFEILKVLPPDAVEAIVEISVHLATSTNNKTLKPSRSETSNEINTPALLFVFILLGVLGFCVFWSIKDGQEQQQE